MRAALESITIPHNVSDVGNYAFRDCTFLKSVRYEDAVIGGYIFVSCSSMREFTIAKTVTKIGEHCFNYCKQLETITYEDSIDNWNEINKGTNWEGKSGQDVGRSGLTKIQCLDGHLDWDNETKA